MWEPRHPAASNLLLLSMAMVLLAMLLPFHVAAQTAENPKPIVQAVLFYSPTCPHCHQVINEFLVPMQEEYGDQLQVIGIDTTHPAGGYLYGKAMERFEVPQDKYVVPILIVDDAVLIGGAEIPERLPQIIEEGLAAGGIGWPDIPDLTVVIPDLPPSADPAAQSEAAAPLADSAASDSQDGQPVAPTDSVPSGDVAAEASVPVNGAQETDVAEATAPAAPSARSLEEAGREIAFSETEAPPPDPVGFGLAGLVLLGMLAASVYATRHISSTRPLLSKRTNPSPTSNPAWAVPLLALLGLGVALYLSYVEMNQLEAVCGPVGECNLVQSSPYARLLGIPIAVLGVLSYLAIIALWIGQRRLTGRAASLCSAGLILLTVFSTLFSIYLTALELFVIGAVCAWCLTSAVVTTAIMVLTIKSVGGRPPAAQLRIPT